MPSQDDLVKSIRSGKLHAVRAMLDAGAPIDTVDGKGQPGLPLAMACFLGHTDIVHELVQRGAKVNLADNSAPISPLSMALRGQKRDVVRLLITLGATVPESMLGSLDESEQALARSLLKPAPVPRVRSCSAVEEINVVGCYGTDTVALEADVMRIAREMAAKKKNYSGQ